MAKKLPLILENGKPRNMLSTEILYGSGSSFANYFSLTRLYSSPNNATALTTAALVANTLYAMPFICEKRIKVDSLRMYISVILAGSNLKAGIYADNGNCYPSTLQIDTGQASGAAVGVITFSSSLPAFLEAGLYWLVVAASGTITVKGFAVAGLIPILGLDNAIGNAFGLGYSIAQANNNMPLNFPTGAAIRTAAPLPYMGLYVSG